MSRATCPILFKQPLHSEEEPTKWRALFDEPDEAGLQGIIWKTPLMDMRPGLPGLLSAVCRSLMNMHKQIEMRCQTSTPIMLDEYVQFSLEQNIVQLTELH